MMNTYVTPTYIGVFNGRNLGSRIVVEDISTGPFENLDLDTPCVKDFWETIMARSYQPLPMAYAAIEKRNGLEFLRVYDDHYVTTAVKQTTKRTFITFDPDKSSILMPVGLLSRRSLMLEKRVILAAYDDGQTFGIWNPNSFKQAGSP